MKSKYRYIYQPQKPKYFHLIYLKLNSCDAQVTFHGNLQNLWLHGIPEFLEKKKSQFTEFAGKFTFKIGTEIGLLTC